MRLAARTGVPEEDVRRLVSVARRRTFSRGEVVFHRDDPADSLHSSEGPVRDPDHDPARRDRHDRLRGPGDSFGEMALVAEGARRSATVAALEEAETLAVYAADFHRLRREHPRSTKC